MNINELESKNIEPSVEELDLERIAWKVSRDPYRPQMSENDISRAVHQYRRFLSLKIRYPKVRFFIYHEELCMHPTPTNVP